MARNYTNLSISRDWGQSLKIEDPNDGRRRGYITISKELIKDLLGLDKTVTVIACDSRLHTGDINIYIISKHLEETPLGAEAPRISVAQANGYDE